MGGYAFVSRRREALALFFKASKRATGGLLLALVWLGNTQAADWESGGPFCSPPQSYAVGADGVHSYMTVRRRVFRSSDSGVSWKDTLAPECQICNFSYLAADPVLAGWVYLSGGTDLRVLRSTDSGNTWESVSQGLPAGLTGMIRASSNIGGKVFVTFPAALFVTTDAGSTWQDITPAGFAGNTTVPSVHPENDDRLFLPGRDNVWRSDDGGFSWVTASAGLNHGMPDDIVFDPTNPDGAFARVSSRLYRSRDGQSWIDLGLVPFSDGIESSLLAGKSRLEPAAARPGSDRW